LPEVGGEGDRSPAIPDLGDHAAKLGARSNPFHAETAEKPERRKAVALAAKPLSSTTWNIAMRQQKL
jgi:hypothetical protein